MDTNAITSLLESVRKQILIKSLLDSSAIAVTLSAAFLLCAGLMHAFLIAVPMEIWLPAAILLVLMPIVKTLLYARPDTKYSAQTADNWFNGHDLLTTAVDIQQNQTLAARASASLVMSRANLQAARWQEQLPMRDNPALPHYFHLGILAGMVGLFLLVMVQPSVDAVTAQTGNSRPTSPAEQELSSLLSLDPTNDSSFDSSTDLNVVGFPSVTASTNNIGEGVRTDASLISDRELAGASGTTRDQQNKRQLEAAPNNSASPADEADLVSTAAYSQSASISERGAAKSDSISQAAAMAAVPSPNSDDPDISQKTMTHEIPRRGNSDITKLASQVSGTELILSEIPLATENDVYVSAAKSKGTDERLYDFEPSAQAYIARYFERTHND